MTLPAGVLKASLTFGVPLDDAGAPVVGGRVTILAALDRVWSATGDLVLATNIVVQLDGAKVVPLAATDQPGFINAAGQAVTNWTLDAVVDIPGRPRQLITFALPTGGVDGLVIDFDRLVPRAQSSGQTVAVTSVVTVNGKPGPTPVLTAADVAALPSNAPVLPSEGPATLKNTANTPLPFRVRNVADTADILNLTSTGTMGISSTFSANAVVASAASVDAIQASGSTGGIRFGPTAGTTFIARVGNQFLQTDAYFRIKSVTTAGRVAATAVASGAMYFDTTLGKPVWSDGTNWRDAAGTIV